MQNGIRWAFNCSSWNPCKQLSRNEYKATDLSLGVVDNVGGRLLIRKALVQLLKLPNKAIKLSRSDRRKPLLCDPAGEDIQFNVSHDGKYVVLAVESGRKVGVDVMQITRPIGSGSTSQFFHQMKRQFTEQEWKQILRQNDERQQLTTFFRLWCLKESYIKAIGRGIGMGLQRMEFTLSSFSNSQGVKTGSTLQLDGVLMNGWTFEESDIDNEHCVCVAVSNSSTTRHPGTFKEVHLDDILSSLEPLYSIDHNDWERFVNKL